MKNTKNYFSERDNVEEQNKRVENNTIERAMSRREIENLNRTEYHSIKDVELLDKASNKLAKNEWLNPDIWKNKDDTEKRWALEHVGEDLRKIYKQPNPPLFVSDKSKEGELAYYNPEEWEIRMFKNEKTRWGDKLFGKDPREALNTYCHEFRHSYQEEQIQAYKKGFATAENGEKVEIWADNWKHYIEAPDDKLKEIDYERYQKEYEKYRSQPIEKDADRFADLMTKRVYYRFSNAEEFAKMEEKEKFAKFNNDKNSKVYY